MVSRVVDDDIWLLNGLFVKFLLKATSGIFKQLPLVLKSVWKEQKKNIVSLVFFLIVIVCGFFVFLTDVYEINGNLRKAHRNRECSRRNT